MRSCVQELSGWGLTPKARCEVVRPERMSELKPFAVPYLARGLGRSYGDASLNSSGKVVLMERLNRMLSFDDKTGVLRAEGGVSLADIIETFVPRGWFLPVTPGTKFVTLGGCFACDVHGKNHHHAGSFAQHVKEIELLQADHQTVRCSATVKKEIFWATAGGMGLTGVIKELVIQMVPIESAFVKVTNYPTKNLEETLTVLSDPAKDEIYSVAWIDCLAAGDSLGRGIVMNGHHALLEELPKGTDPFLFKKSSTTKVPCFCPSWFLGSYSVKAFNKLYYSCQAGKTSPFLTDYDRYFYPLDAISNWNRIYGKKGFLQYQFVVPHKDAHKSLNKILEMFSQAKYGSFLAVLKRFGPQNPGYLSFPHEGFTLALDIPMNGSAQLLEFLTRVDREVLQAGGRVYLAKDARLSPETFRAMYPRYQEWLAEKHRVDPLGLNQSDLSRRLKVEGV